MNDHSRYPDPRDNPFNRPEPGDISFSFSPPRFENPCFLQYEMMVEWDGGRLFTHVPIRVDAFRPWQCVGQAQRACGHLRLEETAPWVRFWADVENKMDPVGHLIGLFGGRREEDGSVRHWVGFKEGSLAHMLSRPIDDVEIYRIPGGIRLHTALGPGMRDRSLLGHEISAHDVVRDEVADFFVWHVRHAPETRGLDAALLGRWASKFRAAPEFFDWEGARAAHQKWRPVRLVVGEPADRWLYRRVWFDDRATVVIERKDRELEIAQIPTGIRPGVKALIVARSPALAEIVEMQIRVGWVRDIGIGEEIQGVATLEGVGANKALLFCRGIPDRRVFAFMGWKRPRGPSQIRDGMRAWLFDAPPEVGFDLRGQIARPAGPDDGSDRIV